MLLEKIQECTCVQLIIVLVVITKSLILLYNVSLHCELYVHTLMCLESCLFIVQAKIISGVGDLLENETNPIIFNCQVTGEPVPYIRWYFKGVMINVSDASKYNVSNTLSETTVTSLLAISNVQSSDVGTYTCQAENIFGFDQSSGILTVYGKFFGK